MVADDANAQAAQEVSAEQDVDTESHASYHIIRVVPFQPQNAVLCAVDLSEPARRALAHAAAFARILAARMVVLRVSPAAAGEIGERAAAADEVDEFVRTTLPADIRGPGRVEILLRAGEPAGAITDAAAEICASLIVVGTHGRGALVRAFLGSTATTLLRETDVPIAVVPVRRAERVSFADGHAALHVGTIVVPLDLHSDTTSQLAWAGRLAPSGAGPLLLLHVVPPGQARGAEIDRIRAAASHALGERPFRAVVREGRVVPEVIAAVHQEHGGLVVMGRSSDAPGAMAYDVLRRTDAIVVMAP